MLNKWNAIPLGHTINRRDRRVTHKTLSIHMFCVTSKETRQCSHLVSTTHQSLHKENAMRSDQVNKYNHGTQISQLIVDNAKLYGV